MLILLEIMRQKKDQGPAVKFYKIYRQLFNCKRLDSCYISLFMLRTSTYQAVVECEYADVSSMVDVVASHDGVCIVLDPDASQCVA